MIILLVLSGAGIIAFFSSEGTAGLFIVATIMHRIGLATIYSNKVIAIYTAKGAESIIKYVVLRKC